MGSNSSANSAEAMKTPIIRQSYLLPIPSRCELSVTRGRVAVVHIRYIKYSSTGIMPRAHDVPGIDAAT